MSLRKENSVIVLLGAGASSTAGIPTSQDMINKLEKLVGRSGDLSSFQPLYFFVRSAIHYADGIAGNFDNTVNYNIERLVNTLSELNRKIEHPLYPFIGSWNIKLTELGGSDFSHIREFRKHILEELQRWVSIGDHTKSSYYKGIFELSKDYQYPLRVFSLNYDMCVEKNCGSCDLERGFGNGRVWDWKNFDKNEGEEPDVYLYKLHGSIDWYRDEKGNLTFSDEPANLKPEDVEIIFGTDYKLQYVDPFLFFMYQLRQWTLDAKLIITIGYGFGDMHINGILEQALKKADNANERKLLAVGTFKDRTEEQAIEHLERIMRIERSNYIKVKRMGADDFMKNQMNIEDLNKLFPDEDKLFDEIE